VPCGARHGHGDEAGIVRSEEQFKFPPLSRNCYPSSGHALQIPKRSASLPGRRSQRLSALSADVATGLPARDELDDMYSIECRIRIRAPDIELGI